MDSNCSKFFVTTMNYVHIKITLYNVSPPIMVMVKVNYHRIRPDISEQNIEHPVFVYVFYIDDNIFTIYLMSSLEPLRLLEFSKS